MCRTVILNIIQNVLALSTEDIAMPKKINVELLIQIAAFDVICLVHPIHLVSEYCFPKAAPGSCCRIALIAVGAVNKAATPCSASTRK